jgi:hypothetical protein
MTLKDLGQRPIGGASILVDRTRSKQFFYTSQNIPSFCTFHWDTTFSSAKRVSGWPRERNLGGVTGELRRLGLRNKTLLCALTFQLFNYSSVSYIHDVSILRAVQIVYRYRFALKAYLPNSVKIINLNDTRSHASASHYRPYALTLNPKPQTLNPKP